MKHNQDDFFKGVTRQFAGMALVAVIANLAFFIGLIFAIVVALRALNVLG